MQPYLLVDPITIRFDTTVKSVSVALACLNYGSYHLAVYDGADSLLSEREVASPPCQIAPVYETIEAKRIRRVVITTPIMPPGVPELPNQTKPTREYPYMMVSFIPDVCIAPDSVLNNRQVREGLDRELKQSIADSLERSGWLFRNSGTGEYVVQYYSTPTLQTPCNVDTPLHPNFPPGEGFEAVAPFHTHPLMKGLAPPSCGRASGSSLRPGPSLEDQRAWRDITREYGDRPMYIIDRNDIYPYRGKGNTKPVRHRDVPGCTWL